MNRTSAFWFLGLTEGATPADIRTRIQQLTRMYHPDKTDSSYTQLFATLMAVKTLLLPTPAQCRLPACAEPPLKGLFYCDKHSSDPAHQCVHLTADGARCPQFVVICRRHCRRHLPVLPPTRLQPQG